MRLEKKPSKMHKMPKKISSQIKQSKRLTKLKMPLMKNPLHQMMKKQKLYKILKGKEEVKVLHLKAMTRILFVTEWMTTLNHLVVFHKESTGITDRRGIIGSAKHVEKVQMVVVTPVETATRRW